MVINYQNPRQFHFLHSHLFSRDSKLPVQSLTESELELTRNFPVHVRSMFLPVLRSCAFYVPVRSMFPCVLRFCAFHGLVRSMVLCVPYCYCHIYDEGIQGTM